LDPFTLPAEERLRLGETEAVRRRFDVRNRRALSPVLLFVGFLFFADLMSSLDKGGAGAVPAALGLALCLGWLFLLRHLPPAARRFRVAWLDARAPWVIAHFGAILRGGFLLLYLLAGLWAWAIDQNAAFVFLFTFLLFAFRLPPAELLALHGVVVLGVVPFAWRAEADVLAPMLIGLVLATGAIATIGVYRARAFRRQFLAEWERRVAEERERTRVRQELALAREVQLSMLPEAVPSLPWLDVAAACLPAAEVGGDYYDFFPAADGESLAVVVADVAGHGLASGLVLATVRSGLSLLMDVPEAPQVALPRLDRLVRGSRRRMLVTLALLRFDRRQGRVTVTTAGHPPILVRRAGGAVEELCTPAPPLGTHLAHAPRPVVVPFAPGDAFLLFTDGLTEAEDASGTPYGQERLAALLAEHRDGGSAAELCADVLADLYRHRGEAPQEDDLTLVALVAR
jgi:serine phosphatase RsbU (regulator of sigma subunit)